MKKAETGGPCGVVVWPGESFFEFSEARDDFLGARIRRLAVQLRFLETIPYENDSSDEMLSNLLEMSSPKGRTFNRCAVSRIPKRQTSSTKSSISARFCLLSYLELTVN